jgi:hypothetical protein
MKTSIIDLDENLIDTETIAFSQSDPALENLDIVNIWTILSPEEANKKYSVFLKR